LTNLFREPYIISESRRKIEMGRVCGKNVRRKACEEMFKYIAEGKGSVGKSRK
jgi:hypothetical protein